jgi:hypothetical protein
VAGLGRNLQPMNPDRFLQEFLKGPLKNHSCDSIFPFQIFFFIVNHNNTARSD